MSNVRWRVNQDAVRGLLKSDGAKRAVYEKTREVLATASADSECRADYQDDQWTRPRGAVIAGYERGATAEHTREVLLRALGGE